MGWNSLAITHDFMARQVAPGAFCIDATAGKGRDAVLLARLCGPAGRVVALDIQPQAVEATRRLAEEATRRLALRQDPFDQFLNLAEGGKAHESR